MRTTVTIDDDVLEAARTLAEASGRTLSSVLSELARRALQPRAQGRREAGLPQFDVPPNARLIPAGRAAEILASEGLDPPVPAGPSGRRRAGSRRR